MTTCRYLTIRSICYDNYPISCSQIPKTISGSLCAGGTFSTTLSYYNCNLAAPRSSTSIQNCNIYPVSHTCNTATSTTRYLTATLTRAALVITDSGCYLPLSSIRTYYEVYTFRVGSVNGIVATDTSFTPQSPAPGILNSPGFDSFGEPLDSSSPTYIILIAAGCSVFVIILAVIAYVIIKIRRKNQPHIIILPTPGVDQHRGVPFARGNESVYASLPLQEFKPVLVHLAEINKSPVLAPASPPQSPLLLPGNPVTPNFQTPVKLRTHEEETRILNQNTNVPIIAPARFVGPGERGGDWRDGVNRPLSGFGMNEDKFSPKLSPASSVDMENMYRTLSVSSGGSNETLTRNHYYAEV
ncbi:hypothetical protein HK098_002053 [Nowakowskiella sp. JEL0407]|nr:hypothetical protein HK098_002053 [Nowakowskiella sp. JEL0407]